MKPRHLIPALFLFLLIAYPLSYGPWVRYNQTTHSDSVPFSAIEKFYRPLWWLCETWQPLADTLTAYINLWVP